MCVLGRDKEEGEEGRQRQRCMPTHAETCLNKFWFPRPFQSLESMETEILPGDDLDFDTVTCLKCVHIGTKM